MGNLSTCDPVKDGRSSLINMDQSIANTANDIDEKTVYSNIKSLHQETFEEKINQQSQIERSINDHVLLEDEEHFDSQLFYCWVTGNIQDANSWQFKFKLHITDKQGKKGYFPFNTNYSKIQQIYCSAYSSRHKYFPQTTFSDQFRKDHNMIYKYKDDDGKEDDLKVPVSRRQRKKERENEKLALMQRYMVLYQILWAEQKTSATKQDVQTCCDALIKLLNAPLFVEQKSKLLCSLGLGQIIDLLQYVAKQWMDSLTKRAKQHIGKDRYKNEDSPIYAQLQCSHLRFHTLSLVERANNMTSNHWGIKLEGDRYLLSLDLFNNQVVYFQLIKNDAIGQRIAWYSWINKTQFIDHWVERVRVPIHFIYDYVTFYDIGLLVCQWKQQYNKYHVFENNCQHFARDMLSVFALNAAKKLTDDTQNVFITANTTLKKELERIDSISMKLNQQLNEVYGKIKVDEMWIWLEKIGLSQYYRIFEASKLTMHILGNDSNVIDIIHNIISNKDDKEEIIKQINILQQNNWQAIQSWLKSMQQNNWQAWLINLKLKKTKYVIDQFEKNGIDDIATLCDLTEENLKKDFGMDVLGDIKKILRAIQQLRSRKII